MAWPNKDNGSGDKPGNVYEFKPKLEAAPATGASGRSAPRSSVSRVPSC